MKLLKDYVGELLLMRTPVVDDSTAHYMKLLAVEDSGVWIESQFLTERFLKWRQVNMSATTFVVFVPWPQLIYVLVPVDGPAISDDVWQ